MKHVETELNIVRELCNSYKPSMKQNPPKSVKEKQELADRYFKIPMLHHSMVDVFHAIWSTGTPLVVDVSGRITGEWTPEYFDLRYGKSIKVSMTTIQGGNGRMKSQQVFLRQFLTELNKAVTSTDIIRTRVR